jgi:hypothetical protein
MAEPHDSSAGSRKRRGHEKRKEAQLAAIQSVSSEPQSEYANAGGDTADAKSFEKTMTRWTIVLGISTVVLSIATIISAYFLFATDQTIKKQIGTALVQLRAYAGFQQIIYVPKLTAEPGRPEIFLGSAMGVTWKNFGITPAKEFEYWISAKWYPAGVEPDFSKPSERISEHNVITLGSGTEISSAALFVPAADVEKAMSGQGRVFFWGEAIYRDVFPDTPQRHFHFCHVVSTLPKAVNEPAAFNVYKSECNYSD